MLPRTLSESPAAVSSTKIRVIIADDRREFLQGLGLVLSTDERIEVVGLAENGEEAIARALELVPDVVLMDVRMPGLSGIEAARVISQMVPIAKIVMLTSSDEEDDHYDAIKGGASGYLLKETARGPRCRRQPHSTPTRPVAPWQLTVSGPEGGGAVAFSGHWPLKTAIEP